MRPAVSEQVLSQSGVAAGTYTSATLDSGNVSTLRAQLNVTALSGTTPTVDVFVEDTLDGTNWNTVATFTSRSAPGREVANVSTPFAERLRVRAVVAGAVTTATFAVHLYSD